MVTNRLTAETAEIAEIRKNCMRIPSAFLCELCGEISSFILRSDRLFFCRSRAELKTQNPEPLLLQEILQEFAGVFDLSDEINLFPFKTA